MTSMHKLSKDEDDDVKGTPRDSDAKECKDNAESTTPPHKWAAYWSGAVRSAHMNTASAGRVGTGWVAQARDCLRVSHDHCTI